MGKSRILVVEDDRAIRRGVVDALRFAGHEVIEAPDGPSGLEAGIASTVDLVLLDILLPGMDGFAVLAELRRAKPSLPVIVLTARGTEEDRVRGLEGGADDYVVKPFSARELLARVEAVLRRSPERPRNLGSLDLAGRTVDFDRREVRFADGTRCEISDKESEILRYLAGHPDRAVGRDELLQRVWGLDPRGLTTRTVDMHIARLRARLRDDGPEPAVVLTVRSKGYMLAR
jgi:two-component system, OmpR family, alkaline phosphatase synthesis response regulator PhoP